MIIRHLGIIGTFVICGFFLAIGYPAYTSKDGFIGINIAAMFGATWIWNDIADIIKESLK